MSALPHRKAVLNALQAHGHDEEAFKRRFRKADAEARELLKGKPEHHAFEAVRTALAIQSQLMDLTFAHATFVADEMATMRQRIADLEEQLTRPGGAA